jgi:hypothetical protein
VRGDDQAVGNEEPASVPAGKSSPDFDRECLDRSAPVDGESVPGRFHLAAFPPPAPSVRPRPAPVTPTPPTPPTPSPYNFQQPATGQLSVQTTNPSTLALAGIEEASFGTVPAMLGDFFSGVPTRPVNLQSPSVSATFAELTTPILTYTNAGPTSGAPVKMLTTGGPLSIGIYPSGVSLPQTSLLSIAQSKYAPNGFAPSYGFSTSTLNRAASSPPLPAVPFLGSYQPQATSGTVLNVIVNPIAASPNDLRTLENKLTLANASNAAILGGLNPQLAGPTTEGYVSLPQPPGSSTAVVFYNGGTLEASLPASFTHVFEVNLPFAATAGSIKLGDNESPVPRDRIIFDYSLFDNSTLAPGGINVNRFTAGFEKTLFSEKFSIEFRIPFATTFDSNITVDANNGNTALTNQHAIELGNAEFLSKAMLWRSDTAALTGGLGVGLPTASDITVNRSDGVNLYRIENTAPHLMPFIGGVWTPTERTFIQHMAELDIDITGNKVVINEDPNKQFSADGTFTDAGRLKDPVFAFYDISAGYWLFHCPPGSDRCVTGLASMLELHYNQSLAGFNSVSAPMIDSTGQQQEFWNPAVQSLQPLALQVGGGSAFTSLNLTAGVTAEIRENAFLSLGCSVPLIGGPGHEFDYEVRVNFSYYFGRSTKGARTGAASAPSTL